MQQGKVQAAMDAQSLPALSHGLTVGGQQSCIGSLADISGASSGCILNAAAPTTGSIATDMAMRRANMVRKTAIWPSQYPAAAAASSSDDFARNYRW
jgi:hypothetical protein